MSKGIVNLVLFRSNLIRGSAPLVLSQTVNFANKSSSKEQILSPSCLVYNFNLNLNSNELKDFDLHLIYLKKKSKLTATDYRKNKKKQFDA